MSTIEGKRWYRPREVARLGLIQSSAGTNNEHGNYNFILQLIKTGKLVAKNYGSTDTKYWLISEDEINRYHSEA